MTSLEVKPDIKNDIKSYQKDVKQHLKDIKDILARDKLKFGEEKKKNRKKLLKLKKQQEQILVHDTDSILTKIHNDELSRRQDLLNQINVMKKKLQKRKHDLDSLLSKDNFQVDKNAEASQEINKNSLGRLSKDIGKVLHFGKDVELKNSRTKRALFEPVRFGNYQPRTLNLKTWRPADVLSFKREQFLGSNGLTPPNDYNIFKNIFDQNRRYGYMRKRRNIKNGENILDNEVDGYLKKPNKYGHAKEDVNDKIHIEKLLYKAATTEKNTVKKDFDKEENVDELNVVEKQLDSVMNLRKTIEENNKFSKNISDSTIKGETEVLTSILTTLTGFLKNLGKQLGTYVKGITPT